jgi:hypothetical protein
MFLESGFPPSSLHIHYLLSTFTLKSFDPYVAEDLNDNDQVYIGLRIMWHIYLWMEDASSTVFPQVQESNTIRLKDGQ